MMTGIQKEIIGRISTETSFITRNKKSTSILMDCGCGRAPSLSTSCFLCLAEEYMETLKTPKKKKKNAAV